MLILNKKLLLRITHVNSVCFGHTPCFNFSRYFDIQIHHLRRQIFVCYFSPHEYLAVGYSPAYDRVVDFFTSPICQIRLHIEPCYGFSSILSLCIMKPILWSFIFQKLRIWHHLCSFLPCQLFAPSVCRVRWKSFYSLFESKCHRHGHKRKSSYHCSILLVRDSSLNPGHPSFTSFHSVILTVYVLILSNPPVDTSRAHVAYVFVVWNEFWIFDIHFLTESLDVPLDLSWWCICKIAYPNFLVPFECPNVMNKDPPHKTHADGKEPPKIAQECVHLFPSQSMDQGIRAESVDKRVWHVQSSEMVCSPLIWLLEIDIEDRLSRLCWVECLAWSRYCTLVRNIWK